MNVLSIIEVILGLLEGVATAFGKMGMTEQLAGVQAAIESLSKVHSTTVTKQQVDALKITPTW